jgi:hypothetical protein
MTEHHDRSAATIAPLLPCPFCGNKPAIEDRDLAGKAKTIFCAEHDCIGPSTTAASYDDAAVQWNRRAGAVQSVGMPGRLQLIAEADGVLSVGNAMDMSISGAWAFVQKARDFLAAQPPAAPVGVEQCQKCGCGLNGEAALVTMCHPCADGVDRSSAGTTEVRCYGCGSPWNNLDLAVAKRNDPKIISCCPERKPLDIDAWMERAVAAEQKLRTLNEPQTSWQPIETAPKDGTLVLICGFGSEGYYVADAKWDGEWLLFHPDNDDHTEPSYNVSYWMPLPAPPSEVSRPHGATPSALGASAPAQRHRG